jgi:predicted kinase
VSGWFPFCPRPPRWRIDWAAVEDAFPWVRRLADCPQDPVFHAEGDVWTHTRMVGEALAETPGFRARPADERAVLFAAALLHDVAKPIRTALEGDRLTARGHAWRGAIEARQILWGIDAPFAAREQVCALVRWHQHPFFLIERDDARRRAIEISQTARCDLLALLAEADARGRVGQGRERLLENAALFAEYCREQGCLDRPYAFPSDHARFLYFRRPDRDPDYGAYDDTRCEVVVMSGLPGAGKDRWLRERMPDLPVVSLDALRAAMGVDPEDPQGGVVRAARERARDHLRRGEPFAWNGTNVSRRAREACVGLCADYRARVRVVYVEAPEARLRAQNRARPAPVPDPVIDRLLDRWEVPDPTEAHHVEWWVGSGREALP